MLFPFINQVLGNDSDMSGSHGTPSMSNAAWRMGPIIRCIMAQKISFRAGRSTTVTVTVRDTFSFDIGSVQPRLI
ncbi:MAG: hypothetical protein PHR20_09185 [Bacteroidales bacterium]|nr:hypothetical protein [Bacteroidales bacterium]